MKHSLSILIERKNHKKSKTMNTIIVIRATHIQSYKIKIEFSDDTIRVIDFELFFKKNPHPQWEKYLNISNFKKFKIVNGNLVWGRDWDLIFPVHGLYTGNILEHCC